MSPALLLALSLQATAPAPSSTAEPASSAAAPANDDDKTVCKREQATGSRMFTNTCMTKREWRQREQQNQSDINQQRTLTGPR